MPIKFKVLHYYYDATYLRALGRADMATGEQALTGLTTRHVQTTSKALATLARTRVLALERRGARNCALRRVLQVARCLELVVTRTLHLNVNREISIDMV